MLFHELVDLLLLASLPGFLDVLQLLGPLQVFHLQGVALLGEPPRVHGVDAVIIVATKSKKINNIIITYSCCPWEGESIGIFPPAPYASWILPSGILTTSCPVGRWFYPGPRGGERSPGPPLGGFDELGPVAIVICCPFLGREPLEFLFELNEFWYDGFLVWPYAAFLLGLCCWRGL